MFLLAGSLAYLTAVWTTQGMSDISCSETSDLQDVDAMFGSYSLLP